MDDDDAYDDYVQEIFHKRIFLSKYQCLQIWSSFVLDYGAFPTDFFMLQSFDKKISGQTFILSNPKRKLHTHLCIWLPTTYMSLFLYVTFLAFLLFHDQGNVEQKWQQNAFNPQQCS
jgi:hypothetical protein